ncbi:hypothetical protein GIB67_027745 [Kingdonia uniflora]|uniref:Uncharacterized protein n=1 Tax=Kingdonia uniflora TaxID=39325 RepID=A0A7J7PBW9_9MAGN|nr:hypothetical protein GIB67_027745 [Kingdonia uniflora]
MSKMAARLMKGIYLGVEEEIAELKRKKVKLERNIARLKFDSSKEGKRLEPLKASQVVEVNKLQAEARVDLENAADEPDKLGHHLMSKRYSEDEVDVIRVDTYVEEEEDEETEDVVVGVVDGLDGVTPQTVRDNQWDDNERPELENEKGLKDIHLRIKDLEVELAKERDTSVSMLSSQAEVQVELESGRLRKNDVRQCNQEFVEEFDRMREANEDREDQHVKMHFKFVEAIQTAIALERSEEGLNRSVAGLKNDLAKKAHDQGQIRSDLANRKSELRRLKKKLVDKDNDLKGARDDQSGSDVAAEQLTTTFSSKDMEFRMLQHKCNKLNVSVDQLKTELVQANLRVKNTEAGERLKKNKNDARVSLVLGDVISLSARIWDREGDVARIQGHVQKGNKKLRECEKKLDAIISSEQGLGRTIIGKYILILQKDELLRKTLNVERLSREIKIVRAQIVDLEATN